MKLLIPFLAIAAFVYALWLVVFRRRLPNPQGATGLRKRFYLAVLLFVGFLTIALPSLRGRGGLLGPSCYEQIAPGPAVSAREGALATLEAVWLTLDSRNGESFARKLDAAVEQGQVQRELSAMLIMAFRELASHKELTRGEGRKAGCYASRGEFAGTLKESRESAYKQLELLKRARRAGTIDRETAEKCQAVLAIELQMLSQALQLGRGDSEAEKELLLARELRLVGQPRRPPSHYDSEAEIELMEQYAKGELKPGEAATEAAAFIVRMETGQVAAGERSE
jgi:hypothetical protein